VSLHIGVETLIFNHLNISDIKYLIMYMYKNIFFFYVVNIKPSFGI